METNGLLSGNCVTGYKSQDEETATVVHTEPRLPLMILCKFYATNCVAFGGVNQSGVNLRRGHVGMIEHLAYRIYVSPGSELESGECITETVERYPLCDTCRFQPFLQRFLRHRAVESLEDNPLVTFTAQCQHLRTERVD